MRLMFSGGTSGLPARLAGAIRAAVRFASEERMRAMNDIVTLRAELAAADEAVDAALRAYNEAGDWEAALPARRAACDARLAIMFQLQDAEREQAA